MIQYKLVLISTGFDPTAESLHLGNLLGIIVLSWIQRCGHTSMTLICSGTARIKDSSGKSLERPELDVETLERNSLGIREAICRILRNINGGGNDGGFVVLNNYDWWKYMRLLEFLKRVGRFARVETMIEKESVKKRLESEQGMSTRSLLISCCRSMILCICLILRVLGFKSARVISGGNITAGTNLKRKISRSRAEGAYGLTFPIFLKSDGTKN